MPDNLCQYFWAWVATILMAAFIVLGAMVLTVILLFLFPLFIGGFWFGFLRGQDLIDSGMSFWIFWSIGMLNYTALAGIVYGINKFFKTDSYNIVSGFAAAKKDKFCPRIDWDE